MNIRQAFDFDFGAFPVPSSPALPIKADRAEKDQKVEKDEKKEFSPPPKRASTMPDHMTHADHQLAGEYRSQDGTIQLKITYRHVLIQRRSEKSPQRWEMELLNPFALRCRTDGWCFAIRDTPNGLYWIHLSSGNDEHDFSGHSMSDEIVFLQKTNPSLDKKCHFSFHSIRNLFLHVHAMNAVRSVTFSENGWTRSARKMSSKSSKVSPIELLNPLSCRVVEPTTEYWYLCDLRNEMLIELLHEHHCLEMNVYEITSLPPPTRLLLTASPYFATTRHTDQTDPSAQSAHIDADTETF